MWTVGRPGADAQGNANDSGWPYNADAYERLRYAGHPDVLATKDKTFRLGP